MARGEDTRHHPGRQVGREHYESNARSQLRLSEEDAQRALPSHAATMAAARRGERWAQDDLGDYD